MVPDLSAFLSIAAPVPGPRGWFEILSFLTFTAHILLMNALLGTLLILFLRGLRTQKSPSPIAQSASSTAHPSHETLLATLPMFPKSLAVVVNLGVPPILFIQVLYAQFFYTSAILQAIWWLGIMFLVMMAYYGLYLAQGEQSKFRRSFILGICSFLLLFTALIQTSNATLVQNPQFWVNWLAERGSTLFLAGTSLIIPRLVHTLLATLAVGGLCLAAYGEMRRKKGVPDQEEAIAEGLGWFKHCTLAQIVAGTWFFMSLPAPQQKFLLVSPASHSIYTCLFLGLILSIYFAYKKETWRVVTVTVLMIALMIGLRAILRHNTLLSVGAIKPLEFSIAPSVLIMFLVSVVVSALVIIWLLLLAKKVFATPDDQHSKDNNNPDKQVPNFHRDEQKNMAQHTPSTSLSGEAQS